MKKESNIIAILDLVLFMGAVGYFLQFIVHVSDFISLIDSDILSICVIEKSCVFFFFLLFLFVMFIVQLYIVFLFKKKKKNFPVWFLSFFSFGLLSEIAIYINQTIMSSSARLVFNGIFLVIFTIYLFYSEEGKRVFSN